MINILSNTSENKELYVCKFWGTVIPSTSDVVEGDYYMFTSPVEDSLLGELYQATSDNQAFSEMTQIVLSNSALYLDNSDTNSPKLYKANKGADSDYFLALIGIGGGSISPKPSWNNANDNDVVTKGAIREHYEGTDPKG